MKSFFKYNTWIICLLLFIGFIVYLFLKSNQNNDDSQQADIQVSMIDKYVYLDVKNTLHINSKCWAIGGIHGELGSSNISVTRVPVDELTTSMLEYTCSRCVNDSIYDYLLKISKED